MQKVQHTTNLSKENSLKQLRFHDSHISFESKLERDFLIFHAFRKDVIDLFEKPISIPFTINGIEYMYTPSYLVQFYTGGDYKRSETKPLLVDITPSCEWKKNWRDFSIKWRAAIEYCKQHGFRFKIYDETRIRHKGFENINYISQFKNSYFNESEKNYILEKVKTMDGTTIGYILELFFKGSSYRQEGKNLIFHLLANGQLEFNYWNDLTEESEIWYE